MNSLATDSQEFQATSHREVMRVSNKINRLALRVFLEHERVDRLLWQIGCRKVLTTWHHIGVKRSTESLKPILEQVVHRRKILVDPTQHISLKSMLLTFSLLSAFGSFLVELRSSLRFHGPSPHK